MDFLGHFNFNKVRGHFFVPSQFLDLGSERYGRSTSGLGARHCRAPEIVPGSNGPFEKLALESTLPFHQFN